MSSYDFSTSYSAILSHYSSDAAGDWMSYGFDQTYPQIDWESNYTSTTSTPINETAITIDKVASIETREFEGLGVYSGQWKNQFVNGLGTFVWLNGAKFEGHFTDGLRDGYGISTSSEGLSHYEFWRQGELKQILGVYSGESCGGHPHGFGKLHSFSSTSAKADEVFRSYEGFFNNGKKEGYGVYLNKSSNGFVKYVGQWMNDQANGLGVLNFNNVQLIQGRWENNSCHRITSHLPLQTQSMKLPDSPSFFEETSESEDSNSSNTFEASSTVAFSPTNEEDDLMGIENP